MRIEPLQIEGATPEQNKSVEDRLQAILESWEGTPHMAGQQSKGKGVDCVRFVAAVLDEMAGTETDIKSLPQDTGFHQREKAMAGMRLFIKNFNGYKVEDDTLQPGDVIVTGPLNGGPGHAIIVGTKGFLWHSATNKVVKSGLDALGSTQYKYKATMRGKDRRVWI